MASRLEVLKQIEAAEKRIADFRQKNDMRFKKNKDAEFKREKELIDLKIEAEKLLSENLNKFSDIEKSIGGISNSYRGFKDQQQEVLDIARSAGDLSKEEINQIDTILDTSRQISDLTVEDEAQLEALTKEYEIQLSKLSSIDGANQDILDKIKNQNTEATSLAGKTKQQKEVLSRSAQANEELKNKMQAFSENVETAITHLTSMTGLLGIALIAAGKLLDKFYETNKVLGSVGRGTSEFSRQASYLSFFFDESNQSALELANNLGGTNKVSDELQTSTQLIASNMGISASESVNLLTSLTYLNKGSSETARNMAASARSFAEANNIPIASMMGDLAKSSEEFAKFGDRGGKNIIEAVGAAKALGVEMSQISSITNNLLDFETSVTKELELSAMLGRNINLSKARALAFDNDMAGAAQETLRQLGGIAEFEKMNAFQRQDSADLLGVSVAELNKMIANQGSLNDLTAVQNDELSNTEEVFGLITAKWAGLVAGGLGGLALLVSLASKTGGVVGTMGRNVGSAFTSMGSTVGNVMKSVGGGIKGFLGGIGEGIGAFLRGMAGGIAALAAPPVLIGLGALTLAFMGIGFGLNLMAPAIEALGNVMSAVFGGLVGMLSVITLEKAAAMVALGVSFNMLSIGIGGLAIAALLGGGKVISFIEKIGSLDTSVLSKNAMAVNSFAEGIGRLNAELQTLDTEKLEKLEDVSLSLSVGAAVTGVADSIGGMIDAASNTLFGEGGTDVQTQMLTELKEIKNRVGVTLKLDGDKVAESVGKTNDASAKNISSLNT